MACVSCGRIRCRSTRFAHPARVTVVSLGRQQQHCSSPGEPPYRTGALAWQHVATLAFNARLKATQRDLLAEVMPTRSAQPSDVGHHSITEQNSIDRPVDISLGPNFAHVHGFRLDQRHLLTAKHPGPSASPGPCSRPRLRVRRGDHPRSANWGSRRSRAA